MVVATTASLASTNRTVQILELLRDLRIRCDLLEARHRRQSVRDARRVVIRQTVIAPALDVERREIESTLAGLPEEEVPQAVDDLVVDLLGIRRRQIFE